MKTFTFKWAIAGTARIEADNWNEAEQRFKKILSAKIAHSDCEIIYENLHLSAKPPVSGDPKDPARDVM